MHKWIFLVLLLSTLFYSCKSSNSTIKLGLLFPITPGDTETTYGSAWVQTAQVAAETINNQSLIPGYNLEFVVLDTLDTSTGTVMAAIQCALVEHCIGVIGAAYSQYSEIAQYVLQNFSIPQISPASTASELSDKRDYPTFLRTIPSDSAAGPAIAKVISHFGWDEVGLIVGSDTYSNSLYNSFFPAAREMNIKIQVQTFLETVGADYYEHVAELKNGYTQIIVIFAQQLEAGEVMKEAYKQGILGDTFVWIGGDTLSALNITDFPNGELLGNLVVSASSTANTTQAHQFEQQMASLNLTAPYTSFVYDAVYAYAYSFRQMVLNNISWEGNPQALLSTLKAINFTGVTGDVQFDINGDRTKSAFDILNWMADGQTKRAAMINEEGQFINISDIIWSDKTTKIPKDYLYLLRYPPPEYVEILFKVLSSVLLASVGILLILVVYAYFTDKNFEKAIDKVAVNLTNTFGGILGFVAVILIVSGVSRTHCIVAPVLMDLSLLICGGVLTFNTIYDLIVGYNENLKVRLISVKTAKVLLYSLWGAIVLTNLGALIGTFSYQQPQLELFPIEQNFYENQCKFSLRAFIILPITIGVIFAFGIVANLMNMYVKAGEAKNTRTQPIEIINTILHSLTIIALVIGAVIMAVITPTQTQIDATLCTIIIVANFSVPCNLFDWWYTRKEKRISYRRNSSALVKRVQPDPFKSFQYEHETPTNNSENTAMNDGSVDTGALGQV